MILITRDRAAIPAAFLGAKRIDKAVELLEAFLAAKQAGGTLDNKYWTKASRYWKGAKDRLKAESFDKCAYCEERTATAAFGDVEHFRPKSLYWWLAFCYDNYLYSCQRCNEQFKSDEFPVGAAARMSLQMPASIPPAQRRAFAQAMAPDGTAGAFKAYRKVTAREAAGLPDPYVEDPEPLFKWVPGSPALREVRIAPASTSTRAVSAFNAVEKYFGLNREELLRARWHEYEILEGLKQICEALPPPQKTSLSKQVFAKALSDNMPFLGMKRYFLRKVWKLV